MWRLLCLSLKPYGSILWISLRVFFSKVLICLCQCFVCEECSVRSSFFRVEKCIFALVIIYIYILYIRIIVLEKRQLAPSVGKKHDTTRSRLFSN